MRRAPRVELSPHEREQLGTWAHAGPPRSRLSLRARIVLEAAGGATNAEIGARLGVHQETAARWRSRFVMTGLEGISREAPRAGAAGRVAPATVRRIVRASLSPPPASSGRWTTRSLARSLRVNHMLVHRVWTAHGLRNRPPAAAGAPVRPRVDLGGAFVTPNARALVFTVDDQPGPVPAPRALPELVPNPTSNPEFSGPEEYSREVVRAVGAIEASRPRTGPKSEASLLVFLRGVERSARTPHRLEVVFDRPVARLGRRVAGWLAAHTRFRVFTPGRRQKWSEAVDAWLHRWEPAGLDRESLGQAPAFAREFPKVPRTAPRGGPPVRFSWGPTPLGPAGPELGRQAGTGPPAGIPR
jgi:transposase